MQTRLCDSKTCTKILRKFGAEGTERAEDLRGGRHSPLEYLPVLKKMVARQERKRLNTDRFIPILSNSAMRLPGLNIDAYVSLPNYSVNGLLFQLSEKGI